jgi:hypothetical protein
MLDAWGLKGQPARRRGLSGLEKMAFHISRQWMRQRLHTWHSEGGTGKGSLFPVNTWEFCSENFHI